MSDCEGLPVGKRQIYIYPGVLPTRLHSQIAKSHMKLLAFEGSRSRSRERRNSPQPLRIPERFRTSCGGGLARVVSPGFCLKAQGLDRRKGSVIQADALKRLRPEKRWY